MKKIFSVILICLSVFPLGIVRASELKLAENAKSAILLEPTTGEIIFEKNSHEKLHPASMTKMMSMLLVVEAIEKGVINWDDIVTVSENAASMGGSQILLEVGEQMSVDDLFKGVAVASGNDAVVALAEKIGGSEAIFVDMMNDRAKELGLTDTNFKNPHGLDEANHYSSAYDMAMIAKELVKHPKVLEYTSIYEDYLRQNTDRKIWLVNTNKLVRFYTGVDGLKTGYTSSAGYCLTATAKKNNSRFIAVVMGEADSKTRNKEISEMLDYAFAQYEVETMLSTNSVVATKEIEKGKQKYAEIVPLYEVTFLNKKGTNKQNASYEIETDLLKAPIKHGDIVGNLVIKQDNEVIRTVPVTVKIDIEKANILELYWRHLTDIFKGDVNL
ncbi:MAG: D-alanyl-D-alanine carboxypeptidase [Firmicutes bacterium]|nr:D-alanyl-D-alanine carboxypeptidase [Bacillota bacterium]